MFSGLRQRIDSSRQATGRLFGRGAVVPAKGGKSGKPTKGGKPGKPAPAGPSESRIRRFVRETRSELRKVTWPTREQATRLTGIVIAFSVVVGLLMGGVDFLFSSFFQWLIGAR